MFHRAYDGGAGEVAQVVPMMKALQQIATSAPAPGGAASARAQKLDRARDDLDRLTRGLGSRHYPDTAAVEARLAVIAKGRRVGAYLRSTTGTDPDTCKPTLDWHFDQAAIGTEAATDGWYALLTNLDPGEADAAQVLLHYQGQEAVERRYSAFKGPLAVAAIYLKNNRRITAMITVICLALLIFSLIERQVRSALRAHGRTTVAGLDAGRPAVSTTRLIFQALAGMRLIPAPGGNPHTISQPTPL